MKNLRMRVGMAVAAAGWCLAPLGASAQVPEPEPAVAAREAQVPSSGAPVPAPAALAPPAEADALARGEERPALQTVVTGTRSERLLEDVPVATEVITRREIERSGARDLAALLETHPGADFQRTFRGSGLRLMGLDAKHIAVLVDGQRVSGAVGNVLDLSRFTLRNVERVELVKGPGAALFGSEAMGGVINIVTRTQSRPLEAGLTGTYGMRNELDLRGGAGMHRGPWDVQVGGGRRTADRWDRDPSDAATTGNDTMGLDVNGQVAFVPTGGPFRARLSSDYQWQDAFGIDSHPSGAVFDRRERNEWFNTTLATHWSASDTLGFDLQLRHSLFRSQFQQDQRAALDEDRYERALERQWMATLSGDLRLGLQHRLTAGVEPTIFHQSTARIAGGRAERVRTGIFIQDEWTVPWVPQLVLLAGARLDVDSQFGVQPIPRLSALWEAAPGLKLRGSWGLGFRAPSFTELYLHFANPGVGYVVEGNPALRPEHSQGLTLNADWELGPDLQVGASLFQTSLQDLVTITTLAEAGPDTPLRYGYDNVSRALSRGGELNGRGRLFAGTWLDLGWALTDARDLGTGELLEGRAAHRVSARLSGLWRRAGLEWMVRGVWSSPRRFGLDTDGNTLDEAVWTSPTTELSARVGFRPWSHVQVFLGVNNALDEGDAFYIPLAPLQVYGGATVSL